MSRMRPVIIKMKDGNEMWFPSMSDAARALDVNRETIRQIIENGRFGRRNYQGIEDAWWSDYDRNKVARCTIESLLDQKIFKNKSDHNYHTMAFYLYEQYSIPLIDNYFEYERHNRAELYNKWTAMNLEEQRSAIIELIKTCYGEIYNSAECIEDVQENIDNLIDNYWIVSNYGTFAPNTTELSDEIKLNIFLKSTYNVAWGASHGLITRKFMTEGELSNTFFFNWLPVDAYRAIKGEELLNILVPDKAEQWVEELIDKQWDWIHVQYNRGFFQVVNYGTYKKLKEVN